MPDGESVILRRRTAAKITLIRIDLATGDEGVELEVPLGLIFDIVPVGFTYQEESPRATLYLALLTATGTALAEHRVQLATPTPTPSATPSPPPPERSRCRLRPRQRPRPRPRQRPRPRRHQRPYPYLPPVASWTSAIRPSGSSLCLPTANGSPSWSRPSKTASSGIASSSPTSRGAP